MCVYICVLRWLCNVSMPWSCFSIHKHVSNPCTCFTIFKCLISDLQGQYFKMKAGLSMLGLAPALHNPEQDKRLHGWWKDGLMEEAVLLNVPVYKKKQNFRFSRQQPILGKMGLLFLFQPESGMFAVSWKSLFPLWQCFIYFLGDLQKKMNVRQNFKLLCLGVECWSLNVTWDNQITVSDTSRLWGNFKRNNDFYVLFHISYFN